MNDLLRECERLSLETRVLHLPTAKAQISSTQIDPRDKNTWQVRYFLEPGFCAQKPAESERRLPEGIYNIEYIVGRNPRAGHVSLYPTKRS